MAFADLLVQRCAVIHIGPTGGIDRFGNPEVGETSRDTDVPTRLDQLSTDEMIIGRDTGHATYRAFFLPTQAIAETDAVEMGADVYRVTGPPWPMYDATQLHHLEVRLDLVTDLDWMYP